MWQNDLSDVCILNLSVALWTLECKPPIEGLAFFIEI